jgi:hypothetical protein
MRVYVAGAYSADNVISILDNMRKGMRAATEVLLMGHAPFAPWLDYQFQLMLREGEILTVHDYYHYSLAWLEVSDVVYVIPGWKESKGTRMEITRAHELRIPVVFHLADIQRESEHINCSTCAFKKLGWSHKPCSQCLEERTFENHYPRWLSKEIARKSPELKAAACYAALRKQPVPSVMRYQVA